MSALPCQSPDNAHIDWHDDTVAGQRAAQRACRPCPARTRCLEGALARQEKWGVWGGQLFQGGRPVHITPPTDKPLLDAAEVGAMVHRSRTWVSTMLGAARKARVAGTDGAHHMPEPTNPGKRRNEKHLWDATQVRVWLAAWEAWDRSDEPGPKAAATVAARDEVIVQRIAAGQSRSLVDRDVKVSVRTIERALSRHAARATA